MIDKFDAGSPITSGDLLIEDADGAPLPHELQPGSSIYQAVYLLVPGDAWRGSTKRDNAQRIMLALAPILWPLLPSNDHSPSAQIRAAMSKILADMEAFADGQCTHVSDSQRCDRGAGHPGVHVSQS